MKRIVALILTQAMVLSLPVFASAERHLTYGIWWDVYYNSGDADLSANPAVDPDDPTDQDVAMFENVKLIEDEYDVTFEWANLTYQGVQDSINSSILAGDPDCDVYTVELGWGVPAAMNGLATDLRDVLPADDPLFKGEDTVFNIVSLPDGSAKILAVKSGQAQAEATYPLAFNLQMIQEANLEDPRDLVERGEWTWDKFREYCEVLTKDTDGDGVTDVYGYGAWANDALMYWIMSNGTYIAATEKENLSSPEVGETLKFLQDLYLDGLAYPIPAENGWDVCRWLYRDKKVAFTTTATWILSNYDDYNYDGKAETTLDFDMIFVDYPIGPSGNAETNATKIAYSNYYMIPAGVKDPKLVYDAFRAYWNWYHDDTELRDEPTDWWYTAVSDKLEIQDWNVSVEMKMGERETVDFYKLVENDVPILQFLNGEYTPAQLQESYKQVVQDALDNLYK